MNLNHINLSVTDVQLAAKFFARHFDFTIVDAKPNDTLSVLKGKDGFTLVLMHERMNEQGNHGYPDSFHIGFYLEGRNAVIAKHEALTSAGLTLAQEPQKMRKTFGFYFRFQNLLIEITTEEQE